MKKIGSKPYNHIDYINLLHSCKLYGYIKIGRGKPPLEELYKYIYANMSKRDPINIIPKKQYDTTFYRILVTLARKHGLVFTKVGKLSIKKLFDFLNEKGIALPEKTLIIKQKRVHFSECKTKYSKLIFQAKLLGYEHKQKGRPSNIRLKEYILQNTLFSKNDNPTEEVRSLG